MAPPSDPDTSYFFGFDIDEMVTNLSSSSNFSSSQRPAARRGGPLTRPPDDDDDDDYDQDRERLTFKTSAGPILSCLGCVVGTGNIWRFPRIVANHAKDGGGLAFLLVWLLFLLLWSIPMIMIEYATGRYTRKAVVDSFRVLIGPRAVWCGLWVCAVSFLIGCYYSVILGWCFYYLIYCMANELPTEPEESHRIFKEFAMVLGPWPDGGKATMTGLQMLIIVFSTPYNTYTGGWGTAISKQSISKDSKWPVLTTGVAVTLSCLCVVKGVRTIEKVCLCLVPVLLLILAFTFVWALSRPGSDLGLLYLFKPNWASLRKPRLWMDALSQNAFDTGAGAGLLVPYASYMTRKHGIVRYATLIPSANNLISLIAGMTIFSAVFSTLLVLRPQYTQGDIISILTNSGPGNTGLTFIWLPVLFHTVGHLGRVLACLFFLCLSFAGLTSLVAYVEQFTQTLEDWGVKRVRAVLLCLVLMFGVAQASANNTMVLTNQDFVWGFALIINGLMFLYLLWHVGAAVYREEFINEFATTDWHLAVTWDWVVRYVAPVEAVALIVWWAVDLLSSQARHGPAWYKLGTETFMLTILQWAGLMLLLIAGNMVAAYWYFRRRYRYGESTRLIDTTYT